MSYGGQNYGGQKGGQQMQPGGQQGQQWQNEMMTVPPGYFGDSFYSMGNSGRNRFASDPNMGTGFPTGNANPLARPGVPTSGPSTGNPLARGPNYNFGSPTFGSGGDPGTGTGYNPLQAADQNPYSSPNGTFVPPQGFDPNSQYTSFDWNNISPATRALLGYRG